jgi:HAD superfamily hydrolase (TIGR01450 family)
VSGEALIAAYDAALFDLDGVIYLGPEPVPGAAEAVAALRARDTKVGFVTNNPARTPAGVAEHLRDLGISAGPSDVVTSAQAGAHLLRERFGAGARVLVAGGGGIWAALAEAGLTGVRSADDDPVAVIQGWSSDLMWEQLNEAAIAINRGAHWLATNTDLTRPTDRGIVPGNGAAVAAVRLAVAVEPEVAGKPYRPLFTETIQRLGARRPIFVGDRIDTDIAGARDLGIDALFVLTGAHGAAELLAAGPEARPTHLGWNIEALLEPPLTVTTDADRACCEGATVVVSDGRLKPLAPARRRAQAVALLWAAASLAWTYADAGRPLDVTMIIAALADPH